MTRVLLLSVLLTALLGVRPVRAGEAAPAPVPTVEDIAVRLASTDAKEREQGEVLLVRALRVAPDRADLLARLAAALRAPSAQTRPAPEPEPAPPAPLPSAPTPPAPPGPATPDSPATPTTPRQEGEPQTVAPAAPTLEAKQAKAPAWTLKAWGVSVPAREADAFRPAGGSSVESQNDGPMHASGSVEQAQAWAQAALRLADAEPLGEATLALADDELQAAHLGAALQYRCCVVPVKGGSWAVETGSIDAGLSLRARVGKSVLHVEPMWITVAQPVATVKERPAAGVDPIELDRPDWSVARTRHEVGRAAAGTAALLVVPGLLADAGRRLVLVLELRPKP